MWCFSLRAVTVVVLQRIYHCQWESSALTLKIAFWHNTLNSVLTCTFFPTFLWRSFSSIVRISVIFLHIHHKGNKGSDRFCFCFWGLLAWVSMWQNMWKWFFVVLCWRANLSMVKELGDKAAQGRTYGNLGNTYYLLGEFETAVAAHEKVGSRPLKKNPFSFCFRSTSSNRLSFLYFYCLK